MPLVDIRDQRLHVSREAPALVERLKQIGPILNAEAPRGAELGHLTGPAIAALHESGVFRMSIPADLGGYEVSPRQGIEIIETIATADASAAWVVMALQLATGVTAAYQAEEATAHLFGGDATPLMAGQGNRMGKATQVDGGHLLSGSWSFASGLPHATHIHTGGQVVQTGEKRIFTFPKNQATVVDNWNVIGLKATGSIDYSCEDVFVPESYSWPLVTKSPVHGGAYYRVGLGTMGGIAHGGWALGVGRRMLNDLAHPQPGSPYDNGQFHADYAGAESLLRSARSFIFDVWADIEATLDRGELLSSDQESLARLALNNATRSAEEVSHLVYKWGGTTAMREGDIQRYFRDMHAGSQHISSSPAVLQNAGRMLARLAPDSIWAFGSLTAR
jgi:alkylation response protein AidB-like acyl-CoA dehydrogenase